MNVTVKTPEQVAITGPEEANLKWSGQKSNFQI